MTASLLSDVVVQSHPPASALGLTRAVNQKRGQPSRAPFLIDGRMENSALDSAGGQTANQIALEEHETE
jgi:hypothetical protein